MGVNHRGNQPTCIPQHQLVHIRSTKERPGRATLALACGVNHAAALKVEQTGDQPRGRSILPTEDPSYMHARRYIREITKIVDSVTRTRTGIKGAVCEPALAEPVAESVVELVAGLVLRGGGVEELVVIAADVRLEDVLADASAMMGRAGELAPKPPGLVCRFSGVI